MMEKFTEKLSKIEDLLIKYKNILEKKHLGFKNLKAKLAGKPGVTDPGALAAAIGKKKYSEKKMESAATKDKPLKEKQKLKKSEKEELFDALVKNQQTESALLLKNWDQLDSAAVAMLDQMR